MYRGNSHSSSDYSNVAPPSNLNKRPKHDPASEEQYYRSFERQKRSDRKRRIDDDMEDSYWDKDDEEAAVRSSPTSSKEVKEEDEEDPLDAFMAGLEKEVKTVEKKTDKKETSANVRLDIEEEDIQESYYKFMKENPKAGVNQDEEEDAVEYDEDGNPVLNRQKMKYIDPLPSIDHSKIEYSPFEKNFYIEHEEIEKLGEEKVKELRDKLGIRVMGADPPKPCISFAHYGFDEDMTKAIVKAGYSQPTPIQCQAIPAALSGRDVLGIAKTGSGKTAAYLWPMLIHLMDQPELKLGDGPIGLILVPTRELAQQIHSEGKKFAKVYGVKVACCFGGGSKWEQSKELQEGAEIVVATPGRMIDLVKCKATNLERVTMLVLDEADRMFDMGFGIQIRSICDHVRPDRQTLLFSATFKKKVEKLARDVLLDPVKVIQGDVGVANEDVTQKVLVFPEGPSKWEWLTSNLVKFMSSGSVLIFVTRKANADELAANLKAHGTELVSIHGDMNQIDRNKAIGTFKRQEVPVMVATDVAARGLDITHIRTVVNYDVARDIDTHTHRIGRTGRAGDKTGVAYTLVTEKDKEFAGHLVRNLEGANQAVPKDLLDLAMQSNWFAKSRSKKGGLYRSNGKRPRFPPRVRPGLGAEKSLSKHSDEGPSSITEQFLQSNKSDSKVSQPDRVAAMKNAFRAQFQANFRPATDSNPPTSESPQKNIENIDDQKIVKKKSRWQ